MNRYRLIPTRGLSDGSRWVYASSDDSRALRDSAEAFSDDIGKPVLVVRSPEDGQGIRNVYTVGEDPNEKKGRVR